MKSSYLKQLADAFSRMPSIGTRTAERMALYVARVRKQDIETLIQAIRNVKDNVVYCQQCQNISEETLCSICADHSRNSHSLCVVEQASDVIAIEKTGVFRGKYHVLHGSFSTMDGIGPKQIKMGELSQRIKDATELKEVIIATNPNVNGEATAMYITKLVKSVNPQIKTTRIGFGLAIGSDIAYVDKATMQKSLETRSVL